MNKLSRLPKAVRWNNRVLKLLDQRYLPNEERVMTCERIEDVFEAILTLSVRGAPAIGIAAAYGLLVSLFETKLPLSELKAELARAREDHQYDNLVHKRELESVKNPIPKLRNKGLM